MNFYYNDKLVRRSKKHNYTHAVVTPSGSAVRCSGSQRLAEQFLTQSIRDGYIAIEQKQARLQAIKEDRETFTVVYKGQEVALKTMDDFWKSKEEAIELIESGIADVQKRLDYVKSWKVVALECR